MVLDLLAVALLTTFAVLGALRGALCSGVRLASWVVGYVAALALAPQLGPMLAHAIGMSPPLAMVLTGTGVLGTVWALGGLAGRAARRWQEESGEPGALDRPLGATFGALQGALIVLLVGWLGLWLEAAERVGASLPFPAPADSVTTRTTGRVVEASLDLAVGDDAAPAARVASRFAARPAESMERLQALLENPRIAALRDDSAFWGYVRHGAIDAAMNQGSFLGIAHDATLRRELADLGLVGQPAALDPRLFRNEARAVLEEVGTRVQRVAESPEMKALAMDPDVRAAAARGDTTSLLAHPGVRKLIGRALASEEPTGL